MRKSKLKNARIGFSSLVDSMLQSLWFLFAHSQTLYMAIVLYTPSLALNVGKCQFIYLPFNVNHVHTVPVTGLNKWISVFVVGIVCTCYTTIVSADILQQALEYMHVTTQFIKFFTTFSSSNQSDLHPHKVNIKNPQSFSRAVSKQWCGLMYSKS